MTANPAVTETSVTAGELVLGPAIEGYRYGTLSVTVHHGWGTRPGHVLLGFHTTGGIERTGSAWSTVTGPPTATDYIVTVPAPPTRGTARHTFAFRQPVTARGGTVAIEVAGATTADVTLGEANPWNNGTTATVRTSDQLFTSDG
jgi:hypothetical protein